MPTDLLSSLSNSREFVRDLFTISRIGAFVEDRRHRPVRSIGIV
jgi:hypothetical protein